MKILVTGATGFVGRHLFAEADAREREMFALTRTPGSAPRGSREIVVGEIDDKTAWGSALAGADAIVHLAARVHVMNDSTAESLHAYRAVNTEGTLRLARAAADSGVRRFVFVSSIKVNGEMTTTEPFSSSSVPSPKDPYGESKREAERGLGIISQETGLEVVVVRPPVVYGPGVGGNILRIAMAVSRGIPLPLGAIHNRRSMLSVESLVRAIHAAAAVEAVPATAVLLGDPEPVSTTDLVQLLAQGLERRARLVPVPAGLLRFGGSVLGRRADVLRLTEDLIVNPNWHDLGINSLSLPSSKSGLVELGRWIRQSQAGGT